MYTYVCIPSLEVTLVKSNTFLRLLFPHTHKHSHQHTHGAHFNYRKTSNSSEDDVTAKLRNLDIVYPGSSVHYAGGCGSHPLLDVCKELGISPVTPFTPLENWKRERASERRDTEKGERRGRQKTESIFIFNFRSILGLIWSLDGGTLMAVLPNSCWVWLGFHPNQTISCLN